MENKYFKNNELTEKGKKHVFEYICRLMEENPEESIEKNLSKVEGPFFNQKHISLSIWEDVIDVISDKKITEEDINNGLKEICEFGNKHVVLGISYNFLNKSMIENLQKYLRFTDWEISKFCDVNKDPIPIVNFIWRNK